MKILIIKLGALGDVIRTLCILPALKEKYQDSEIFWITKENALEIFEDNPYIKKVFSINEAEKVKNEKFNVLYNFDIEEEATKLASDIKADKKYGFYSEGGFLVAFNLGAEYYLNTVFDDELKKENKKTYQEMMFMTAELEYEKQHCPIFLNDKDREYTRNFVEENNIKKDKLIGIHLGASSRWPSKAWHKDKVREFIIKAKERGFEILLFSGPDEKPEEIENLILELKKQNIDIYKNNPNNTIKQFTSLVGLCKAMVCSDSLALHVSLALKKPTVALFFCTSPNEVEDYGLLKKIVSPLLYNFFPEKQDQYSEELVKSISAEEVLNALSLINEN